VLEQGSELALGMALAFGLELALGMALALWLELAFGLELALGMALAFGLELALGMALALWLELALVWDHQALNTGSLNKYLSKYHLQCCTPHLYSTELYKYKPSQYWAGCSSQIQSLVLR
jgi:hypothetical protein